MEGTTKNFRGAQIVWYVLGIIEVLLAVRFFLRLLGANPEAGFTSLIYSVTSPILAPFFAVFGNTSVVSGSVFEWNTLLAMVVYWAIAWGILRIFTMARPVSEGEAASKLDQRDFN